MRCKICGKEHKATVANFPLKLVEKQEVFEGRGRRRRSLGVKEVITGYACRWCEVEYRRKEFAKEQGIKADPTGKKTVRQMIGEKIDEIRQKIKGGINGAPAKV